LIIIFYFSQISLGFVLSDREAEEGEKRSECLVQGCSGSNLQDLYFLRCLLSFLNTLLLYLVPFTGNKYLRKVLKFFVTDALSSWI
jgi:hypothetical protein